MNVFGPHPWEIVVSAVLLLALVAVCSWLFFRKRLTDEELEKARRQFLAHSGRLVDGILLDIGEFEGEDGRTLTMLHYEYRIAGVDYECSQDITDMSGVLEAAQAHVGYPCAVRYQPGGPQNSIVVAEDWSGLRISMRPLTAWDDYHSPSVDQPRPGRG